MPHPLSLSDIDGRRVGPYQIQIERKPLRSRHGWTQFALYLKDEEGRLTSQQAADGRYVRMSVLEGIHSRGGRWVKGWIEIGDYFPIVRFTGEDLPSRSLNLSEKEIDLQILRLLSEAIPPGGHLMFAYEVSYESPFHRETQISLMKGVPPVCTVQGALLLRSGFRLVKDWYLAEGGHEGSRKLWGEKPSNQSESNGFDLRTFFELVAFLSRKPTRSAMGIEVAVRKRGSEILSELSLPTSLSGLREGIVQVCFDSPAFEALERAAHRTCQEMEQFIAVSCSGDDLTKRRLSEIVEACSGRSR